MLNLEEETPRQPAFLMPIILGTCLLGASSLSILISRFHAKGLSTTDMVALSGIPLSPFEYCHHEFKFCFHKLLLILIEYFTY
jgi:hypothetical protein